MSIRKLLLLTAGALLLAASCRSGAGKEESWRGLLAESERLATRAAEGGETGHLNAESAIR